MSRPAPYPPSISDTYYDIQLYACVPFEERMAYHYARTDAMIGRGTAEAAWAKLRGIHVRYWDELRDARAELDEPRQRSAS